MKRLFVSVVAIFSFHLTPAQDLYSKYGEVSIEDLKMTSYTPDTTADAIVLFDHGELEASVTFGTTFLRHRRIKFLTKEGFDEWGKFSIVSERGKLSKVKGATYRLVNNVVVKDDVENNSIFKKRRSKAYDETSFVFPNLTEGCIIEYSYVVSVDHFALPEWIFQCSIPTRMSDYVVTADLKDFQAQLIGKLPLTKHEKKSDGKYHR
jgi:hypothetical protein